MEFASYKDAFAQARAAGEEVQLDYGAAFKESQVILLGQAAASPQARQRLVSFDASAANQPTSADQVAVECRLGRGGALQRPSYRSGRGRAADELAADGLSSSLTAFPSVPLHQRPQAAAIWRTGPLALEAVREKSADFDMWARART
jgi:hypothetical protein